jgi:transglutaminase-like putative cysteine protease
MPFERTRAVVCGLVALGILVGNPRAAASRDDIAEPEAGGTYLRIVPAQVAAMALDQLAAVYDTPARIWHLLEHTVAYAFDRDEYGVSEYFPTAEEFWARKRGDCEDYAILAKALLDRNGYTTVLLSAWRQDRDAGGNDGHTVVAFLERGRWNHISNLGYVRADAVTHEELAASIFPDWTRSNTWVYAGPLATRDGLNGWRSATTVVNPGSEVWTLVGTDLATFTTASGN